MKFAFSKVLLIAVLTLNAKTAWCFNNKDNNFSTSIFSDSVDNFKTEEFKNWPDTLILLREEWLNSYENYIESNNLGFDLESIGKKHLAILNESKLRKDYFSLVIDQYFLNSINLKAFFYEIKTLTYPQEILNSFNTLLIQKSIEKLKLSKIPQIQFLMNEYQNIYSKNSTPLFKLTGKILNLDSPISAKGGFHRGYGSIFVDISETNGRDFIFVLMHELYHALDIKLSKASGIFSRLNENYRMILLIEKLKDLKDIPPDQLLELKQWILAGLNTHLFAEWRAKYFCFLVYHQGIKENLWGTIPWVEDELQLQNPKVSLATFVYQHLNDNAEEPKGIFQTSYVAEIIDSFRNLFNSDKMAETFFDLSNNIDL